MRVRVGQGVVVLLAVLLMVSTWWVVRPSVDDRAGDAADFVPTDGYRSVTRDGKDVAVTENALLPLDAGLFSAPGLMAKVMFGAADPLVGQDGRMWRQVTTTYGADPVDEPQPMAFFATDDAGIVQLGARIPGIPPLVFDPPLLALPAHLEKGRTWQTKGSAALGGILRYRTRNEVTSLGDHCLTLDSRLELFDQDGKQLFVSTDPERWCRGRGLVERRPTAKAARAPELADDAPRLDLSEAAGYGLSKAPIVSDDGAYGESPLEFGRVEAAPAVFADGSIHVIDSALGDVLVLRRFEDKLTIVARTHPGGKPLAVTAVGGISVVTTSDRRVCGYTSAGAWLWCRSLPDVVDLPGVHVGAGRVALLALDGRLRMLDARTGRRVWTAPGVVSARFPPLLSSGRIVTVSTEGGVAAWRFSSGKAAWETSVDSPPDSVAADERHVVVSGASVSVLRGRDGTELAYRGAPEIFGSSVLVGDRLLQTSDHGSRILSLPAGATIWSGSNLRRPETDGRLVLGVEADTLRLIAADGSPVASWRSPISLDGQFWVVRDGDALILITNGLEALVLR